METKEAARATEPPTDGGDLDLLIDDLEDRTQLDIHGACACSCTCDCTSCSCVAWAT